MVETDGTRIVGGLVLTLDGGPGAIPGGEVAIAGDRISYVGPRRAAPEGHATPRGRGPEVLDARGAVVMPGLVNAHSHSYGVFAKGSVDTMPLDLFIPHVMPLGEALSDEDLYLAAALTAAESLRSGTTCLMDHLRFPYARTLRAIEAAVRGYLDAGIRATRSPQCLATGPSPTRSHRWTTPPPAPSLRPRRPRAFLNTYPVGMQSHVFAAVTQRVRGMQLYACAGVLCSELLDPSVPVRRMAA